MTNTNILMLLIPKAQVDYLYSDFTIRQALGKWMLMDLILSMLLTKKQEYMKNRTDFDELENLSLKDVESHRNIKAVNSTKNISDLVSTILE